MLDPLGGAFHVVGKIVVDTRGDWDEIAVFWKVYYEARHGDSLVLGYSDKLCTYVKILRDLMLHNLC